MTTDADTLVKAMSAGAMAFANGTPSKSCPSASDVGDACRIAWLHGWDTANLVADRTRERAITDAIALLTGAFDHLGDRCRATVGNGSNRVQWIGGRVALGAMMRALQRMRAGLPIANPNREAADGALAALDAKGADE